MKNQQLVNREERIKAAMVAMANGKGLAYGEAVRLYDVRRSTLHDHMSRRCAKFTKGRDPLFTQKEETQLVKILGNLQSKGHVITPNTCRMAAYLYAEQCNYRQNLNRNTKMAGRKWFTSFIKRNNVRIVEDVGSELNAESRTNDSNPGETRLKIKSNRNGERNEKLKTNCRKLRKVEKQSETHNEGLSE